ncbi:hypothetical protein PV326_009460, partial [Microctonus aethiopoides]
MEWSNSACLNLIDLYREHECLWNPADDNYKNKIKKLDAWNKISQIMKCEVVEVKKKMESLLSSFRRERQRQIETFKTGSGADEIFKSAWFAFKHMTFLMDKFTPKETKNTEELSIENNNSQEDNSTTKNSHIEDTEIEVVHDVNKQEIKESVEETPKKISIFKSPKKNKNIGIKSGPRNVTISKVEEAYAILQDTIAKRNMRDEST